MKVLDILTKYAEHILFTTIVIASVYIAFVRDASDSISNYKRGIQAGALVLVYEGLLKPFPNAFRSKVLIWRGVEKFCLVYLIALVFLVFQNTQDARQLLTHLYPSLGKPVTKEMHTYDDNCEHTWENFYDNLDHYFAVHWVNWFLATLLVRDGYILHFWSVYDEIIELSWQHILPHFRECWWDHVFCDVLLSNTPAIIIGLWVVKKMNIQKYDWLGTVGKKSIKDWDVFRCHRRFGFMILMLIIITVNFLTGFFLINSLWIPPQNPLTVYRLIVWFCLGNLAFREGYSDITSWGKSSRKDHPVRGKHRFLISTVEVLEILISIKFVEGSGNLRDAPTPIYIWLPWTSVIVTMVFFYIYLRFFKKERTSKCEGNETVEKLKSQ